MKQHELHFSKLCLRAKYILAHIPKIKIKNFIVVVTLLNFPYTILFRFSFSPLFNVYLVSLAM